MIIPTEYSTQGFEIATAVLLTMRYHMDSAVGFKVSKDKEVISHFFRSEWDTP